MKISFYVNIFIIFFFSIFLSCGEKNIAQFIISLDQECIIDIGCEPEKTEDISVYSILSKAENGDRFIFYEFDTKIFPGIRDSLIIEYTNNRYTSKLYLRGSSIPEVTPNMELIDRVLQGQSVTFDYWQKFYLTDKKYIVETYKYAHKDYWEGPVYCKFRNKERIIVY